MTEIQNPRTAQNLLTVASVTVIALTFGWFAGAGSVAVGNFSAFFLAALMALGINWLAFIPSAMAQADTYYDTVGAITYLSVIGFACAVSGPLDIRSVVIAAMVAVWCIRLGSFLFRRIHAMGGADSRFEKIKLSPSRFLIAWTLQALWVILTASAAVAAITANERVAIGVFFWIGAAIWVVGIVFETVADNQKRAFKADAANKGAFISTGLWAWCRHPNYFGEIALWTGILVMAIPVLSGLSWLVAISPIFVFLLLTRISGINLQEAQAKARWEDDQVYQSYRARTPALFPRPPRGV